MKTKIGNCRIGMVLLGTLLFCLAPVTAAPPPLKLPMGWTFTHRAGSSIFASQETLDGQVLHSEFATRTYAGLVSGLPNWHDEVLIDSGDGRGNVQVVNRFTTIANPVYMSDYLMADDVLFHNKVYLAVGYTDTGEFARKRMVIVTASTNAASALIQLQTEVNVIDLATEAVVKTASLTTYLSWPRDFSALGGGAYLVEFMPPFGTLSSGTNMEIRLKKISAGVWNVTPKLPQ